MKALIPLGLVIALGALAGCADRDATADPTPSSGPTTSQTPLQTVDSGGYASGLDIQYLDDDGKIKTLKVEDFPR